MGEDVMGKTSWVIPGMGGEGMRSCYGFPMFSRPLVLISGAK
jgi:hypothetical protein